MENDRFTHIHFFTYEEEEPLVNWSKSVKVLQILDKHRKGEKFVIVEYDYYFANYARFTCHYYATEKNIRAAFKAGLHDHLVPKRKKTEANTRSFEVLISQLLEREKSPYANHKGYLRTREYENFHIPWFLAKQGQEINGDLVVQKPRKARA